MGELINFFDLNTAPKQNELNQEKWSDRVDRVKCEAYERAPEILHTLLPGGAINGYEFEAADIYGGKGKSLKYNLQKHTWKDFANSGQSGDIIDLWETVKGVSFKEAINQIADFLLISHTPAPLGDSSGRSKSKSKVLGVPTAYWTYYSEDNKALATVTRYDDENGKKDFIPYDSKTKKSVYPTPRPLYGLNLIKDQSRVVLVEGEKCADALLGINIPATTAMGGSNTRLDKVDWSPLKGKDVIIWPDNDIPGLEYAQKLKDHLFSIAGSVQIVEIPKGKPQKWDAADALEDDTNINSLLAIGFNPFTNCCTLKKAPYQGPRKERQWLVESTFPLSVAAILAAAGDSGKGMLTLDLALKVSGVFGTGLYPPIEAFGNQVMSFGSAVIYTAEDDIDEVYRRVEAMDPENNRLHAPYECHVYALPDMGGAFSLAQDSPTGPQKSPSYYKLLNHLNTIPDLKLVVIDPLASFAHIDVNTDPHAGAFFTGALAEIAKTTGATVIVAHHMTKAAISSKRGQEDPREMIRGTTALVDGARAAYTLSAMPAKEGQKICKALNQIWQPNKCFYGALVKSNGPGDRMIKKFIRNAFGLLEVRNLELEAQKLPYEEIRTLLIEDIAQAAIEGRPFQHTSKKAGIYARREELTDQLQKLSRNKIEAYVRDLIDNRYIVKARYNTEKTPQWLDVPSGPFALGEGEFEPGAAFKFQVERK